MLAIILIYIFFALGVGSIGSGRKIGFFSAFIFSLIFSPLIGWIITLAYPKEVNTNDPVYNDNLHFAMKAYHKGNMKEAYERINSSILRLPDNPEAYLRLGAIYAKDENIDMAIKNVAKAKSLGIKSLELLSKEPFDGIRQTKEWIEFTANDYEILTNQISEPQSNADELLKLAELLDKGLLTQEEFEAQKQKLLNA
tara:strand:- start:45 stop:635 length:591 start_codon:yes stop_codon:yes gene_type:complete